MSAKNNCTFIGNLGRDAEQRFTQGGTAMLSFSLPISSGYGDNVKTSWVRCTAFGKKAESRLVDFLKKGQQISVAGEISLNTYTNKEGIEKSSLELKVDDVALIGNKQDNKQPSATHRENGNNDPFAGQPDMAQPVDEPIPF